MFGKPVEIEELKKAIEKKNETIDTLNTMVANRDCQIDNLKIEIRDLKWKMSTMEKENDLKTEKKLNELKTSMEKSLIQSDLLRTEALAKLEIYEKTDTKADANTIKDMLGKLIEKIGSQKSDINIVK